MPYKNPVVSGVVLVRTAIQSIDYVAGVSGWAITRAGSAEFNNAVIRGSITAGGGTVRLDGGGVRVASGSSQFDINFSAGFLARNNPDDGRDFQMTPNQLAYVPVTPSVNGRAFSNGQIFVGNNLPAPTIDQPFAQMSSPRLTAGGTDSSIALYGSRSDGVSSRMQFFGAVLPFVDDFSHNYKRGENAQFLASGGPFTTVTFAVTFAHVFSQAPAVTTSILSGVAATGGWNCRPINVTASGFTWFGFGGSTTWSNVPCSWTAEEYT